MSMAGVRMQQGTFGVEELILDALPTLVLYVTVLQSLTRLAGGGHADLGC